VLEVEAARAPLNRVTVGTRLVPVTVKVTLTRAPIPIKGPAEPPNMADEIVIGVGLLEQVPGRSETTPISKVWQERSYDSGSPLQTCRTGCVSQ